MIAIDGSHGEGGGQVLRTSLGLSIVTGQPFRIEKIRAGRSKPGLQLQHLASVKAAMRVSSAHCDGAELGSRQLTFLPNAVHSGHYDFRVGSAGSCTLVLQTVLPALMTADGASHLYLEGGTHNPFAPPFDFLANSFLPLLNRMGPRVRAELKRPGFYPKGGGEMVVTIHPSGTLSPLQLLDRGRVSRSVARAVVSKLPRNVAERELSVLGSRLGWRRESLIVEEVTNAVGPGNVLLAEIAGEHVTEVFTAFGQRGLRAEQVARDVADSVEEYLAAGVPVGEHLADQLLIPMALAGGGQYRTIKLSSHSRTNIDIIKTFLNVTIDVQTDDSGACTVTVGSFRR